MLKGAHDIDLLRLLTLQTKHVIIGLFEVTNTSGIAMILKL